MPDDIATFAKGLVTFEGEALTEIDGSLRLTLGLGLEYVKSTGDIVPYFKGSTGLELGVSIFSDADFTATIGPFGADIAVGELMLWIFPFFSYH